MRLRIQGGRRARGGRRRAGPVQLRGPRRGVRPAQLPPGRRRRSRECGSDAPVPAVDSRRWPPTLDPDALRSRGRGGPERVPAGPAAPRRPAATGSLREARDRAFRATGPSVGLDQRARVLLGLAAAEFELSGELDARDGAARRGRGARRRTGAEAAGWRLDPRPARAAAAAQRTHAPRRCGRSTRAAEVMDDGRRRTTRCRSCSTAAPCTSSAARCAAATARLRRGASRSPRPSGDRELRAEGPAQPRVRRVPRRPDPAGARRHGRGRGARPTARRTRSGCSTGRGCCARPGLTSDADAAARAGRRAVRGRPAAPGRRPRPQLARAECALVEGEAERGPALRPGRRADLRAPRATCSGSARPQLLVLQCDRMALAERPRACAPRRAAPARGAGARARRDCRAERRADLARPAELLARECLLRAGGSADGRRGCRPRCGPPTRCQSRLLTREVRALAALHRGDLARAGDRGAPRPRRARAPTRTGFGSLDLRTACAVHGLPLARLGLELAERTGSPAELFAAVERGRAISIRLASVGPPTDERTAELLADAAPDRGGGSRPRGRPGGRRQLGRLRGRVASAAARHPRPGLGARGRPDGGHDGVRRERPGRRDPGRRPGGGHGVRHLRRPPRPVDRRSSPPAGGRSCSTWPTRPRSTSSSSGSAPTSTRWRCRSCPPPLARRRTALARRRAARGSTPCCSHPLGVAGQPLVVSCSAVAGRCCRGACCRRGAACRSS